MKKGFLIINSLCIAMLFLFSCSSDKQEENTATTPKDSTAAITTHDTASRAKEFFYSLPSPLLMAKVFKKTGLKYVEGIANSPDNVSKYSSTDFKALNLGVYSTDLAYCVLNKQTQQATKYIDAVKQLSDALGMSSMFEQDNYLVRFKNNLTNEDSLILLVSQMKRDMDMYMRDNDKEKLTVLLFIGAWTENMYIATQLTKESNKDKIAQRVAEQKHILNNLTNIIPDYQNDQDFKTIYPKLNELKTLFDNLTVQGEEEKLVIDEHQLKAITEKTRDVRKEIVG